MNNSSYCTTLCIRNKRPELLSLHLYRLSEISKHVDVAIDENETDMREQCPHVEHVVVRGRAIWCAKRFIFHIQGRANLGSYQKPLRRALHVCDVERLQGHASGQAGRRALQRGEEAGHPRPAAQ